MLVLSSVYAHIPSILVFSSLAHCISRFWPLDLSEFLLIDGNRFKAYKKIKHQCIIKGDGKYLSIAAASILAKTHRDEFMKNAHEQHPDYNWKQNKGYPTRAHKRAIAQFGTTPLHRMTFNMSEQLKFGF